MISQVPWKKYQQNTLRLFENGWRYVLSQIFILTGGKQFQVWESPNPKEYPCISKDFFDLYISFFTSLLPDLVQSLQNTIRVCLVRERGSDPIYFTYEWFLGGIFKKGNPHLINPCLVNSLTASGFRGHSQKFKFFCWKLGQVCH